MMNDRLRSIVGDPPERRVVGKKAARAIHSDNCCENCMETIEIGSWQLPITIGNYEGFVHEVCP